VRRAQRHAIGEHQDASKAVDDSWSAATFRSGATKRKVTRRAWLPVAQGLHRRKIMGA